MRTLPWTLVALLAAWFALAGGGCSKPTTAETAPRRVSSGVVQRVTAGKPQRKTLALYTTQPGRIEAFEETPLYSKLSGYVQEVLVDIGDAVQKDQPLIRLWVPEMQDELEQNEALVAQAEAEVKQAEAAVEAAIAAVHTAEAQEALAKASIARADADYARWNAEHERIKQLAADGSVTQKLVEETLNQLRAAEATQQEVAASVRAASAAVREAEANVQKAQADQTAAQARQRVAQANLARATTLLSYADIKAPFDGIVTRRSIDTGHYVQPGNNAATQPLLVVARTGKVRVFVDVPEMEAAWVNGGDQPDSAIVQVQSLQDRRFETAVTRTSWSLDQSNRSLRTEIDIPNSDGLLRPGMYAMATILLEQRDDALVLPLSAIVHEGRNAHCYCVDQGELERRDIQVGLRAGEEVEVVSGLDETDTVVLDRVDSLQPGQPVEIITPAQ